MKTFASNGIKVLAISYDSKEVLRRFAERFEITYPLLSDEDSRVIRGFGILNTNIPAEHRWRGVPYPGTYMVGADGLVFDKSFFADHALRDSANDMLQESFSATEFERGEIEVIDTPSLSASAYFSSATVRHKQLTVLTVEVSPADGIHVNGSPVPEGYVPIELTLDESEDVSLERVDYPEPEVIELPSLGERLPAYKGRFEIKARCLGIKRSREEERLLVTARLRYQACDDRECYLPEVMTFRLPLTFLPHVRERVA